MKFEANAPIIPALKVNKVQMNCFQCNRVFRLNEEQCKALLYTIENNKIKTCMGLVINMPEGVQEYDRLSNKMLELEMDIDAIVGFVCPQCLLDANIKYQARKN